MCGGPNSMKVLSGHRPPFILQILLPEGGGSHNGQQHFHHMQDFLSLFDLCWQGSRSYLIFMWSVRCRLSIKWTSEVWSACSIAHGHRHSPMLLSCWVDTNTQIQIHKYKYINTNTQIQTHKSKIWVNTSSHGRPLWLWTVAHLFFAQLLKHNANVNP